MQSERSVLTKSAIEAFSETGRDPIRGAILDRQPSNARRNGGCCRNLANP
jgi:hypothetical protein